MLLISLPRRHFRYVDSLFYQVANSKTLFLLWRVFAQVTQMHSIGGPGLFFCRTNPETHSLIMCSQHVV